MCPGKVLGTDQWCLPDSKEGMTTAPVKRQLFAPFPSPQQPHHGVPMPEWNRRADGRRMGCTPSGQRSPVHSVMGLHS